MGEDDEQKYEPSARAPIMWFLVAIFSFFYFKFIHLKSKNIRKLSSKESLSFEALIEFSDTDD